jgi:hypothetical protein
MTGETKLSKEPKEAQPANSKMQFILKGFSHELGFRVFRFDGVASDRTRTLFTVKADLALSRTYGIPLQELPLLCRALLDEHYEADSNHDLTYSEREMRMHAVNRAAMRDAAAQKRKPARKPPIGNIGAAWRAPQH